jgi:hypothetical protein
MQASVAPIIAAEASSRMADLGSEQGQKRLISCQARSAGRQRCAVMQMRQQRDVLISFGAIALHPACTCSFRDVAISV